MAQKLISVSNSSQDAAQLLAVLHLAAQKLGLFFGILYSFAGDVGGFRLPHNVVCYCLGPDDVLLERLCVFDPGADVVSCFLVDGMDLVLELNTSASLHMP